MDQKMDVLSPYPRGWVPLALSRDIASSTVLPLSCMGRELVLFRSESGVASVFDAYCPHLGTHLGFGGKVDGECIRCPFHAWAFGPDGKCVDIPAGGRIPPQARTKAYPVRERNGVILAWFDEGEPNYEVPELSTEGWSPTKWTEVELKAHVQDMVDNCLDCAHFVLVHASERTIVEIHDSTGIPFRYTLKVGYRGDEVGMPDQVFRVSGEWALYSPYVFHAVSTAEDIGTQIRILLHYLPLPEGRLRVILGISANVTTMDPSVAEMMQNISIETMYRSFAEDEPIWAHKRRPRRPVLCEADAPLGILQRWSRQFYEGPEAETGTATAAAGPAASRLYDLDTSRVAAIKKHAPARLTEEEIAKRLRKSPDQYVAHRAGNGSQSTGEALRAIAGQALGDPPPAGE